MKIIYDKDLNPSLRDFGIDVPIIDSRYSKAITGLADDQFYKGQWYNVSIEDIQLIHDKDYIEKLISDPFSCIETCYELQKDRLLADAKLSFADLVQRAIKNTSGLYTAARLALETKESHYFMGGGMHHAMSFEGRGFCLLHDIGITLKKLEKEKFVKRALVIDVDAHKGCASAYNLKNDPQFFTMSIHMEKGWPLDGSYPMDDPCNTASDLDIPVSDSSVYLSQLEEGLAKLPTTVDLAIVVHGADPYELDELPSTSLLNLSLEQMLQRDQLVDKFLSDNSIPAAYCMAGGYGKNTWRVYQQFFFNKAKNQLSDKH